jgi:hypothetical protein
VLRRCAVPLVALALLGAGCGDDDSASDTTDTTLGLSSLSSVPPTSYEGNGDQVLDIAPPIPDAPFLATIRSTGTGPLLVDALDASGVATASLVNATSPYSGTVPVDAIPSLARTTQLEVQASGPWTIELNAVRSAPQFSTSTEGTGDAVVIYTGDTTNGTFTYTGPGTAVLIIYPSVNGGLPQTGATASGPDAQVFNLPSSGVLQVQAQGAWTISA